MKLTLEIGEIVCVNVSVPKMFDYSEEVVLRGTFDFHANKTLLRLEKSLEQCSHQIALLGTNWNDVLKSKHLSISYLNSKKCSEQGA